MMDDVSSLPPLSPRPITTLASLDAYLHGGPTPTLVRRMKSPSSRVISGPQTENTMQHMLTNRLPATPTHSGEDVYKILDYMVATFRKPGRPQQRDPNWGKCVVSCVDENQINHVDKYTYVCRRHNRTHVCHPVNGDDHPLLLVNKDGSYTCLFSSIVISEKRVMVPQDYSTKDPSSLMVLGDPNYYNKIIHEYEADQPLEEPQYKRKRDEGNDTDPDDELCDDDGNPIKRCTKRRKRGSDHVVISNPVTAPRLPLSRTKSSQEVVRDQVTRVFGVLCDKAKRLAIVVNHASMAEIEMKRKVSYYTKRCFRKETKCITQVKEQIIIQTLRKHERYVPTVTSSQMSLWTQTVELMWFHFSPFRKKPRPGSELAKDSSAGVIPFIFGCLYGMAEGFMYNGQHVLIKDDALKVVIPPPSDLPELGFKHRYKSTGRKAVMRALDASIDAGAVTAFCADLESLKERLFKETSTETTVPSVENTGSSPGIALSSSSQNL
jgi:hypothetical protein